MNKIYRPEHPEPQFRRETWQNLNGIWQFEYDHGNSGRARGYSKPEKELQGTINVPFCPESELSGIGNRDFINAVWYRREITLTAEEIKNKKLFLNIGACDYSTEIWVNGKSACKHKGGYTPIKADITELVTEGNNIITICAEDDTRNPNIPRGKQSPFYDSVGCFYTRTTGIWQTVWLEFTPENYIKSVKFTTDAKTGVVVLTAQFAGKADFSADIFFEGKKVGAVKSENCSNTGVFPFVVDELHLWDLGKGNLYDVALHFGDDTVYSYFGIREVAVEGNKFMLNGRSVFQKLVLDQGFYPDGIYTAPTEEALVKDIELSMAAGFNGARLHQKAFEPRFLYHCDKMGYMVWGEFPDWGVNFSSIEGIDVILPEWTELLQRDVNHPAIIGWCPCNETWWYGEQKAFQYNALLGLLYKQTKAIDPTRLCIDGSASMHVATDIFDIHDYMQDVNAFTEKYKDIASTGVVPNMFKDDNKYDGKMPVFVSEYGGIGLQVGSDAWSYGEQTKSIEEFYERYKGLTHAIIDNPAICGLCYTQLYDVEIEQNGLYTYEREPKFDISVIKEINSKKAAIED